MRKNLYGVEGDTPSFLNVIPNGLHNPEEPMQVGRLTFPSAVELNLL